MKKILPFILLLFIISSCGPQKEISYFQDLEAWEGQLTENETSYSLKIRPDDELSIVVSALDYEVVAPFNKIAPAVRRASSEKSDDTSGSSGPQPAQTYLVSSKGEINFPIIGKIRVEGMTVEEIESDLEKRISQYIDNPIVNVRMTNFQISVLGEVKKPGTYGFNKQRVSILDALAAAEDMNIQGQRDNVFVSRDTNGKKEYFKIDLTRSDIFKSDRFYLQQNDKVYVLPNKELQRDAFAGTQKQFNTSIIVSAVSSVISIIAIITR